MQRLFSRNDSGYWSTFQESTGDKIGTPSKSTALRVWFAKGPALQKFNEEIRPELLSVLRNCDLPTTQEVFLRLYMVGRSPEQAKPMVMICCVDPRIRKKGKTAVKKSGKLDSFPEYGLSSRALPFESTDILQACQGTTDLDDEREIHGVYPQPHPTLVGRRILSKTDDTGVSRWATGGAIFLVGDKPCQMTINHFVLPSEDEYSDSQESEDWDLDDCELDEDFERQWGTTASIADETHGCFQSDSVGTELPNLNVQPIQTTFASDDRSDHLTSTFDEQATEQSDGCTITVCDDVLDYALLELDAHLPAGLELNNTFHDANGATRIITGVSPVPDTETNVVIITSRASLRGVLMPGSTTRRARGSSNFQDIYTVTLDGNIREGDCGSAVVDSLTGTLYGHVVLGCVGTPLAYFVPATEIVQNIQHGTGQQVTLVSPHHHSGNLVGPWEQSRNTHGPTSLAQPQSRQTQQQWERASNEASLPEKTVLETDELDFECIRSSMVKYLMENRSDSVAPLNIEPTRTQRLGYWTVMALVVNRMIGSGIFYSPAAVHSYTGSLPGSIIIWTLGGVIALIGTLIWIELGLSIPRFRTKDGSFSTPRSGGDKNYLEYIYSKTAYRPQTWLLSTFLYGTMFITLGNMAANSVNFASSALRASGTQDPGPSMTRLLAIGGVVLCFFLNVLSRRVGIWLNNIFALMKVLLVVVVILMGFTYGFTSSQDTKTWRERDVADVHATSGKGSALTGLSTAIFAVVFAYAGTDEANFVLMEVDRPRRKFPIATLSGVSLVILLCIAMSACYALVVSSGNLYPYGSSQAESFFQTIFGQYTLISGATIFHAVLALSSLGNIVVMTYTASRVTQEIAKEGILPWSIPIARGSDSLLRRVWLSRKKGWLKTQTSVGQTPVGGLVFQLAVSIVTILAITKVATPDDAYNLLSALAAYSKSISAACLGTGLLFSGGRHWRPWEIELLGDHFKTIRLPILGFLGRFRRYWATLGLSLFTLLSLEIVLLPWVAWFAPRILDLQAFHGAVQGWSLVPALMMVPFVLGIGSLWFWGSVLWARYWERRIGERFVVSRMPMFSMEEDENGCKLPNRAVLLHETVEFRWVPMEDMDGAGCRRTLRCFE